MRGLELAIEQGEPAGLQPRDKVRESHLRCVADARDHRFAEECASQRQAIESAREPVALPNLHRVCEAAAVQLEKDALDRAVDPGVGTVGRGFGAQRDDAGECGVHRHPETVGQDEFPERAREVEAVQRHDPAQLGLDPIDAIGAPVIRHREDPHRIGAQYQFRVDLLRLGNAVGHGRVNA